MSDEKRPSLREAARQGVAAKQQAQAAPPAAGPPQKTKPPVVGVEQVVVRCGHTVPFELFDIRKDKFREGRRKKLTDRDCRDCRMKAEAVRQAAEMEAARKLRLERPKKPRNDAQASEPQARLPHGSRFNDLVWDEQQGQWSGTLTIPAEAPGGQSATFTASAGGVFRLLRTLDKMYRASLPCAPAPDAPKA